MFRDTEHQSPTEPPSRLARRLGLGDAVAVGLAAMLPGILVALGPAVGVAGRLAPVAVVVAAGVALCNALSSAQLAVRHPLSGGTYAYGRARLGPTWGFAAGVAFVVGKVGAAAALATVIGAQLVPGRERAVGVVVVATLGVGNAVGIRSTARLSRIGALAGLATVVAAAVAMAAHNSGPPPDVEPSPGSLLRAAALFFFAFGGYARVATLGEEVRAPERTIPRAVAAAVGIALAAYLLLTAAALGGAPLPSTGPVRAGAVVAAVGALLSLLVGLSRTVFAMAAAGDLPAALAAVHDGSRTPRRAETVVAVAVSLLVLTGGLPALLAAGSFFTLAYYGIANAAALTLAPHERRWPPAVAVAGVVGCAALALSLPGRDVALGCVVLAVAVVAHRSTRVPVRRGAT